MIPQSFIQDLLHRVDIVDVIDRYVKLKKAGANYVACCPFHAEKSPSFTVAPTKQFYHCFGCGAHGTAISFLMEYSGVGFVDAVKDLAQSVGMKVPEPERSEYSQKKASETHDLYGVLLEAARYYRSQLKDSPRAVEYLKGRGLSGDIAKRFGIGYAPDAWQNLDQAFEDYGAKPLVTSGLVKQGEGSKRYDVFRDRIMFPIVDVRGNVIGFGGRVLDKGEPKYLNSPETPVFEKGRELYGLYQARRAIHDAGRVLVVEGYMDVVALAQHGVGYAVATLGTATTGLHVQKLFRQADEVVFSFDGDAAGRRAAWRALENSLPELVDGKSVRFLFLPQGEDPDTYIRQHGKDGFEALLGSAVPLSRYLLDELSSRSDLASAEGRAALVSAAKPLVTKLQKSAFRAQVLHALAERARLAVGEVEALCGLAASDAGARARAAPPPLKAPRAKTAPSLPREALRLVISAPQLAETMTDDQRRLLAGDPDYAPVAGLVDRIRDAGISTTGALFQALREWPDADLYESFAGEVLEETASFDDARADLEGILGKLELHRVEAEYGELVSRGVSTEAERERFNALRAKLGELKGGRRVGNVPPV
ncbi:MAG TPA: DNA primase [Burkholderiales bacterium]|nr:DNA primase [Burkholderiales bacterium]